MKARPIGPLTALGLMAAMALAPTSNAAATRTLYFDNKFTTQADHTCTPGWTLSKTPPPADDQPSCADMQAAANGKGAIARDDYATSGKTSVGFRIDTTRHLTGTVYVAQLPFVGGTPLTYLPGQIGVDLTVSVNGVALPTVSATETVMPNGYLTMPVNLTLPARLNGKTAASIGASVSYTSGAGLMSVLFRAPTQSRLIVPTR